MDYLAKKDLIAAGTRKDLLGNELVLIVPATHPIHVDIGPNFDLSALLGPDGRLSIGDPAHVPAGIYAEQALRKLGLWDKIVLAPRAGSRRALGLVAGRAGRGAGRHRLRAPMPRFRRRCRSPACSPTAATTRSPIRSR